jgi:hypothetical protein
VEGRLKTDWPEPSGATDSAWQETLAGLEEGLEALVNAVRHLEAEKLDPLLPGRDFTVREMLHGIPQHDLYHSGQVLMLRKALRGA